MKKADVRQLMKPLLEKELSKMRDRFVYGSAGLWRHPKRDELIEKAARACEKAAEALAGETSWKKVGIRRQHTIAEVVVFLNFIFGKEQTDRFLGLNE